MGNFLPGPLNQENLDKIKSITQGGVAPAVKAYAETFQTEKKKNSDAAFDEIHPKACRAAAEAAEKKMKKDAKKKKMPTNAEELEDWILDQITDVVVDEVNDILGDTISSKISQIPNASARRRAQRTVNSMIRKVCRKGVDAAWNKVREECGGKPRVDYPQLDMNTIVKQGYMLKKGGADASKKARKRWFVMTSNPAALAYFESQDKVDPNKLVGCLYLGAAVEESPRVAPEKREDGFEYPLVITSNKWMSHKGTKDETSTEAREFVFACESEEDRTAWVTEISKLCKDDEGIEFTEEEISELKRAFSVYDRNGDGRITKDELEAVLRNAGQNPTEGQLASMISSMDLNGDGTVNFGEFFEMITGVREQDIRIVKEESAPAPTPAVATNADGQPEYEVRGSVDVSVEDLAAYRIAFSLYDKDRNGYISAPELKDALHQAGLNVTDDQARAMIGQADLDNDGVVSFTEFVVMIQGQRA